MAGHALGKGASQRFCLSEQGNTDSDDDLQAQQLYGELDDRTVFLKTLWNAFSRRHACFELCSALGVGTIAQDFIAAHASDVKRADARSALAVLLQSLAQAELLQGGTAKVVELIKAFDAAC